MVVVFVDLFRSEDFSKKLDDDFKLTLVPFFKLISKILSDCGRDILKEMECNLVRAEKALNEALFTQRKDSLGRIWVQCRWTTIFCICWLYASVEIELGDKRIGNMFYRLFAAHGTSITILRDSHFQQRIVDTKDQNLEKT